VKKNSSTCCNIKEDNPCGTGRTSNFIGNSVKCVIDLGCGVSKSFLGLVNNILCCNYLCGKKKCCDKVSKCLSNAGEQQERR